MKICYIIIRNKNYLVLFCGTGNRRFYSYGKCIT